MSEAREIVTDAYRLLHAIDIAEAEPSPAEMTWGLRRLSQMIDSWAGQGLNLTTQVLDGNTDSGSAVITDLASTARLAPGLNITGTGIAVGARILTIDSLTQITMDLDATASGSDIALTFAALPFQERFEEGVAAMLALRIAGPIEIPPYVVQLARDGWAAIQGNFLRVPNATFDAMLLNTATQRMSDGTADNE